MENQFLDSESSIPVNNGLSSEDKDYLFTAAKWSRFLGIVGFIATGFIVIAALLLFTMGSALSSLASEEAPNPMGGLMKGFGAMVGIFYLLLAVLSFFLARYMYNFGTQTKRAITYEDSTALTEGFKNLKSFFTLQGILAAILLSIYALVILIGIFSAIMMR